MAASHPSLKLTYFDMRGRAEIARLAFTIGDIPFDDERFPRDQWRTLKASTPFGQVPFLSIDGGDHIAQSHGINRYAGTLAGLYPASDPVAALRVDQIYFYIEDIYSKVMPTFREADPEKKAAIRATLASETFPDMFSRLDKVIANHGGEKWAVGDSMSIADLAVYTFFGTIKTGWLDGIPSDLPDKYNNIMRVFSNVGKHPKVEAWEAAHKK